MKKKITLLIIFCMLLSFVNACTFFKKPIDRRSGFSNHLEETEAYIRKEDWENAAVKLRKSQKTWKQIKPLFQIDIDHDYVNDIEHHFIQLQAYIETEDKSNSLATIFLLQENWGKISQM